MISTTIEGEVDDHNRTLASSPTTSGEGSFIDDKEPIPSTLFEDELQLALNKDAGIEELDNAVSRCKELVLESEQCSTERKWLVRHLIELRLRLQECRDALDDPTHPRNTGSSVNTRVILGHHLKLQSFLNASPVKKKYCDQCAGTIWSMLQAWYQCSDCGYSCHHKCVPHIMRVCAHVTATEKGNYIFSICPEKGLSAQRYLCAECKTPLTFTLPRGLTCFGRSLLPGGSSVAEVRLCDYNGNYYCTGCHWNSVAVIPARVIHNWDMDKRSVCQASAQLLKITSTHPLIHLEELNPKLFYFISELSLVKKLREDLAIMKKYLIVCRIAQSQHLLWKLGDRHHLIDSTHMYSLQDLMDVHTGELPAFLQAIVDGFIDHIKESCLICKGRGHLCEICGNDEIIFPFEGGVVTCSCNAVYHRNCFTRKKNTCPKCARMENRRVSVSGTAEETEDPVVN